MITGAIKSQIDQIWNEFWSGGIANPLEVIEQITYLLFMRRLDDLQTLEENRASRLGEPIARRIFPEARTRKDFHTTTCEFTGAELDDLFTLINAVRKNAVAA
jgi:hypothetical protein